jgi:hypothetical protein
MSGSLVPASSRLCISEHELSCLALNWNGPGGGLQGGASWRALYALWLANLPVSNHWAVHTQPAFSTNKSCVLCSQVKLASNLKLPSLVLCAIGRRNKFWKLKLRWRHRRCHCWSNPWCKHAKSIIIIITTTTTVTRHTMWRRSVTSHTSHRHVSDDG